MQKWLFRLLKWSAVFVSVLLTLYAIVSTYTGPRANEAVQRVRDQMAHRAPVEDSVPADADTTEGSIGNFNDSETLSVRVRWKRVFTDLDEQFGDDLVLIRLSDNAGFRLAVDLYLGKKAFANLSECELDSLATLINENEDVLLEVLELTQPEMPVCRFSYKDRNQYCLVEILLSADIVMNYVNEAYDEVIQDLFGHAKISIANPRVESSRLYANLMPIIAGTLESDTIDPDTWPRLFTELRTVGDHELFAESAPRMTADCIEWIANLPESDRDTFAGDEVGWATFRLGCLVLKPIRDYNLPLHSQALPDIIALSPLPYFEARDELQRVRKKFFFEPARSEPPLWARNRGYIPKELIFSGFEKQAELEATVDMICLAIALKLYNDEHGAFPETLDALADSFGGQIPINPLSGEPYEYQRLDDGFSLAYSWQTETGLTRRVWPRSNKTFTTDSSAP